MSVNYVGIGWNAHKKKYDLILLISIILCIGLFAGMTVTLNPATTIETLLIRSTSITAFLLLNIILCIGPLARLDTRFLPLLYNRRHMGVTMFLIAVVHGVLSTIQFHGLGDQNPIVSIFTAYQEAYNPYETQSSNISQFPFEPFGFLALLILFIMAATSHDFWLKMLGASFWKALHLGVYIAYGSIIVHVAFGALQSEQNPTYIIMIFGSLASVLGLHVASGMKERKVDSEKRQAEADGFVKAIAVSDLEDSFGKPVKIGKKRIAIFRDKNKIHALGNACRHQGGPLGEGRIIDDCVTCPWHGYQYLPETGSSPPPFTEVVPTFNVKVIDGMIYVNPQPNEMGSKCEGAVFSEGENHGSE